MTEKRFQYNVNKNTIEQDGKFVAYMNSVDGVRIANKLNVLQNENEELKKDCSNLIEDNTEYVAEINQMHKENEQLKEQFPKHNSQTYEKLRNSISVSSQNSTQVIKITMKDTDASYAKAVVGCIVQKAPDIIKYCVESASSVNEVDDVQIDNNGKPVSPNTLRNAIIGALVGFVLTLAVVFIREFTNNTFKTEEDIASALNIPLLGIIPSVDSKEFNKNV